ncbi:hypothetical protein EZS27_030402 [termite gut metagenome]|uniref:AlgX/AlgJ SGNH hydrolase-like domain-containing protein n=1 Tax=termite gut metagenome TaxID=433724 RepID=A0A5J4QDI0_9ZZZZ
MKRFLIKISYTVLPFLLPFCIIGIFYNFCISPNESGDLGRLGKIAFGKDYVQAIESNYLTDIMVDNFNGEICNNYDIITIGDSFSQQGVFGYQNYLAHYKNERILNIQCFRGMGPEQTALILFNSGFFTLFSPKVVIVTSCERNIVNRLLPLKFSTQYLRDEILKQYQKKRVINDEKDFVHETINYLRLCLNYNNPVRRVKLNQPLFSVYKNELYFYKDDLLRTDINGDELNIIYENISSMNQQFTSNGIQFFYIITPDKYDLYTPFIIDNPYPINKTLDYFNFPDSSYIINTKLFLQPLIKNGIKDVYMVNDTHWSYIASKALAEKLTQMINFKN